jgi:probable rRNA maturation factor
MKLAVAGSISTIDVASSCIGWIWVCPDAERLARAAARIALIDGFAAMGFSSPERIELGITLTDDTDQSHLNRRYRGQDRSTNVLAFPAWEPRTPAPADAPLLLGDIVLAFETVAREAVQQSKPFGDHFRHLIVHGVLHLLGYDHQREADAVRMEGLEISILAKLGVPDPYRDTNLHIERAAAFL